MLLTWRMGAALFAGIGATGLALAVAPVGAGFALFYPLGQANTCQKAGQRDVGIGGEHQERAHRFFASRFSKNIKHRLACVRYCKLHLVRTELKQLVLFVVRKLQHPAIHKAHHMRARAKHGVDLMAFHKADVFNANRLDALDQHVKVALVVLVDKLQGVVGHS